MGPMTPNHERTLSCRPLRASAGTIPMLWLFTLQGTVMDRGHPGELLWDQSQSRCGWQQVPERPHTPEPSGRVPL